MGKTRDFLNTITNEISVHNINKRELIKKFCDNPNLEKFYRNQVEAFDQKFEQKLRKMMDTHILYLDEKDPYGREPLWGAEAKKALFVSVRQKLEKSHGQGFIQLLTNEVTNLLGNPVIDQPRWPKLKLDNVYQFFKSLLSNKTAYSEPTNKHESKFPKK